MMDFDPSSRLYSQIFKWIDLQSIPRPFVKALVEVCCSNDVEDKQLSAWPLK
jgi:hypothetical protein